MSENFSTDLLNFMLFSQLLRVDNYLECPRVLKQLKIKASNQYQFAAFLRVFHVQTSIKKRVPVQGHPWAAGIRLVPARSTPQASPGFPSASTAYNVRHYSSRSKNQNMDHKQIIFSITST